MEQTLSQILCMLSDCEHVEDAMDLRSGRIIIVKPRCQNEGWERRYFTFAKRWNDDPSDRETEQGFGRTHYWDYVKTVEIECNVTWDERNSYKDHVLRWNQSFITKAASTLAISQHQEVIGNVIVPPSDRSRSTISYLWNSDGNSKTGEQFLDRRRLLHLRRLGGNANDGKNERHQWQGRRDWHEWWELDEWIQISLTLKSFFQISCQSIRCWFFFFVDLTYRR